MINLRELAEQQNEQRAPRTKNRTLKQNHDVKLAESLSPITNKLAETSKNLGDVVKESTQNLGDVIKETNSPQPVIENTPTALPIENEKIQPGVIYDKSLENTLSNMRNKTVFFYIEETADGEIFWNGIAVEKKGW